MIEEVIESGITDILIITGKGKRYHPEDHFDRSWRELEQALEEAGDLQALENIQKISNMAEIHYIRQKVCNGLR